MSTKKDVPDYQAHLDLRNLIFIPCDHRRENRETYPLLLTALLAARLSQ